MYDEPPMARIGALIGSPVRARILTVLFDGRALTATELSNEVGTAPATTSEHLGLLLGGGLIAREKSGRHHYYSLASAEVAGALEGLVARLAPASEGKESPERSQTGLPLKPNQLRPIQRARFCYDHIAGRLGVAIADGLMQRGALCLTGEHYQVTDSGQAVLAQMGVCLQTARAKKRIFAKQCLDWSERRHHISGALGAALAEACLQRLWVQRTSERRVLTVTPEGKRALSDLLGVEF